MGDLATVVWIVSGSVITFLLGIIGFFLSNLHKTIKSLESTVNNLVTFVEVEKMQASMTSENCKSKHVEIAKRLENHENRISKIEQE